MIWAKQPALERRKHIGKFVAVTSMMKGVNGVLRRCYERHRVNQEASCSFVFGATGVGKSTAAHDFLEEIREDYRGSLKDGSDLKLANDNEYSHTMSVTFEKPGHGLMRPVVKVEVGESSTFRDLYRDTLLAIGIKVAARTTVGQMKAIARHQVAEQDVRMIIFDDCQHILEGRNPSNPYQAADVFKEFMKETRVQVVCMGLRETTDLRVWNTQLNGLIDEEWEMEPFKLDLSEDGEFYEFLYVLSEYLPFDKKPPLYDRSTALSLYQASDGYLRPLMKVISLAAEMAIDQGAKTINNDHLAEAYRRKVRVPEFENPFLNKELDIEGFAQVKTARLKARKAEARKGRAERDASRKSALRNGGKR